MDPQVWHDGHYHLVSLGARSSPKHTLLYCLYLTLNGTIMYKMNITLYWQRLETSDWDHKLSCAKCLLQLVRKGSFSHRLTYNKTSFCNHWSWQLQFFRSRSSGHIQNHWQSKKGETSDFNEAQGEKCFRLSNQQLKTSKMEKLHNLTSLQ